MAHTSTSLIDPHSAADAAGGRGPLHLLTRAFAWYAEQRRIKRTAAMLSGLSDRMLDDIGIHRSDIARVARGGRR
jgi:uncharacterized protein YjiS (DUF1127 family)